MNVTPGADTLPTGTMMGSVDVRPVVFSVTRSVPLVVKLMVSAPDEYIPVFVSPVNVTDGAVFDPAGNDVLTVVVTPPLPTVRRALPSVARITFVPSVYIPLVLAPANE